MSKAATSIRKGLGEEVAHRVAFLHAGRVLEEGPPAELFAHPTEERTQQFLQRVIDAGRL